ncbi:GTP pyrophosphokinase [Dactylosporangium sp. CA-139114]|uniref:GTP pyrophosphokinase n=1 Tax=Dactylosporangium sp. CA-139114 TaxID=3239931 RepID=UPI003D9843CC
MVIYGGQSNSDYHDAVAGLDSYGRLVSELIAALTAEEAISCLAVTHRVKSAESAAKKIARDPDRYANHASIHDLLGVRVITYFSDDVDRVGEIIEREFDVDRQNSVDKRQLLEAKEFGYLSLHYVLSLDIKRAMLPEYHKYAGRPFELQIRSTLQHAWAEIEHDLGYKYPHSLPAEIRRRFARIAGLLESADSDFVHLRDQVGVIEQHAFREATDHPESELTPHNTLAFVESNKVALKYENYLRQLLGADSFTDNGSYTDERAIGLLKECGIPTIEELEAFYAKNHQKLRDFAHLWTSETPRVIRRIDRGISVYYIALFNLARLSYSKRSHLMAKYTYGARHYEERFEMVGKAWKKSSSAKGGE